MKTERVTLLTTPEFKAYLTAEARREKVSVAELVRSRCELRPIEDEAVLVALSAELRKAVGQARKLLREGRAEAEVVLAELCANRTEAASPGRARKQSRNVAEQERRYGRSKASSRSALARRVL